MKPLVALLFFVAASLASRAQSTPPPLPPGPLIQIRAPDTAEWVVTKKVGALADIESSSAGNSPNKTADADDVVQDTIAKAGGIVHVTHVMGPKTYNIWVQGVREVMIWPDGTSAAELTKSPNPDSPNPFYFDFQSSDFPDFAWIAADDYAGLTTFDGHKCIVFDGKHAGTIAYVDLQTRLPVALQADGRKSLFVWKDAPSPSLSPPDVVQAVLNPNLPAAK